MLKMLLCSNSSMEKTSGVLYLLQRLSILPEGHRIITETESPFLEAERPVQDIDVPPSDVSCVISLVPSH